MAITATPTHLPPLGAHVRAEVGRELDATLLDLIDLALWGKQLHWAVFGPLFRTLHERLDGFVDAWRDLADMVAERAVAIGYWPDGQAGAIAKSAEHWKAEDGPVEDRMVLRLLARRLAEVSERAIAARPTRRARPDLTGRDDRRSPRTRTTALDEPRPAAGGGRVSPECRETHRAGDTGDDTFAHLRRSVEPLPRFLEDAPRRRLRRRTRRPAVRGGSS